MTTMCTCVFYWRSSSLPEAFERVQTLEEWSRAGWIQASLAPYSSGRSQNRLKNVPEISRKYHVITIRSYLLNNHGFIFIFWDRHWSSYPMLMSMRIWEVQQRHIWCVQTWALQNPSMVDPLTFNDKETYNVPSSKEIHSSAIHLLFSVAQSSAQKLFPY